MKKVSKSASKKVKPHVIKRAKAKTHSVPEYIDDELKPTASKLDILSRYELAEKLERQAHQLRQMQPPAVLPEKTIVIRICPQMKKAVCLFADMYGGKDLGEDEKASTGARWFMESALPMVAEIARVTDIRTKYRDAEDLCESAYIEELIKVALQSWPSPVQSNLAEEEE